MSRSVPFSVVAVLLAALPAVSGTAAATPSPRPSPGQIHSDSQTQPLAPSPGGAGGLLPRQAADFTVLRDGLPVGHHRVTVETDGPETRVQVDISLSLSFAFLTVYRYTHQSHEVWQGGRLIQLDSTTDDNGTPMALSARAQAGGLLLDGTAGRRPAPADAVPTSYWTPAFVSGRPVFDSQDGRSLDLTLRALPGGQWAVDGDVRMTVTYSPGGQWSGMQFRLKGADFRYQSRLPGGDAGEGGTGS